MSLMSDGKEMRFQVQPKKFRLDGRITQRIRLGSKLSDRHKHQDLLTRFFTFTLEFQFCPVP